MSMDYFNHIMDQVNLSEEDKNKILQGCKKHEHSKNKIFLYSKQIAAASILVLISLSSFTTYAAVNAYQEYMNKMSGEEIEERFEEVQQGEKNADSFSRTLTKEEKERLAILMSEYQQGLRFPQSNMKRSNGKAKDFTEEPYYDYKNMIFYIPDRMLSDEELLQIVDLWEKANYSLSVKNENTTGYDDADSDEKTIEDAKEFMKQYQQNVDLSDEEKIKVFAERLMNSELTSGEGRTISLTSYDCQVTLYGEENQKYWLTAENETEKYSIFFTQESTPDQLTVETYIHSNKEAADSRETLSNEQEEVIRGLADKMPEFLQQYMGIHTSITKKEIYGENYLVLTDESGNRYRISIHAATGTIGEFLTYAAGKYDDIDLSGEVID